jgi:hypothetical protein
MTEADENGTIDTRRKYKVLNNKTITLPLDVIKAWGNATPREVVFTIRTIGDKVVVTIEPVVEQQNQIQSQN